MTEKATKIDSGSVGRCKFPALSHDLIGLMALAGFDTMRARHDWGVVGFDNERVREDWEAVAKAMYATLAIRAGARQESIPDPGVH